jgi:hypothetical protein
MQAVVSLLEPSANQEVLSLWETFGSDCGLTSLYFTPHPHISWQIADIYDERELPKTLCDIAQSSKPFRIRCSGVGLFTGIEPVIYILIVKDDGLINFHEMIWRKLRPLSSVPNPHYDPDAWVPHITLAHRDVNPENLDCVMNALAFRPFDREIQIDNLALLFHSGVDVGQLIARYDFPAP